MIIDLSLPLTDGMPVYPGDPNVSFVPHTIHGNSGYSVHGISFGTHAGTHIDAPYHALADGETVDTQSILEACVGDAQVIDVRGRLQNGVIAPESLGDDINNLEKGSRVLLATGWSEQFGKETYYSAYPGISEELAALLARLPVALLGVETPSLHPVRDDSVHRILLSAGIVVVECLTGLDRIACQHIFFSAAPLRLEGFDGSPVRAYGIVQ